MSLSAETTAAAQDVTNNAEGKEEDNSKENEQHKKEEVAGKKVEFKIEESPSNNEENSKDEEEEERKRTEESIEEKEDTETGAETKEEGEEDEDDEEEDEENDEGLGEEKDPEEQEESENERPPDPITIDLNLMKSLYKFRDRPTLPYLLTEYGMEDKDAPPLKQKHKKKKKRRAFGDDAARDKERDKQQEEKHLQIVNDMKKLRDYYYDEYSSLLHNKVQKQRHQIRQNHLAMQTKLSEEEEKARQHSHHVKRRLDRHEFISDDSFLHDIPKSDLYHIVDLQDKLIRDGTLKTQSDLSNFWERIQQPDIFYMYFKVPKSDDPDRKLKENFNENASSKATSTMRDSRASSVRSMQMQNQDHNSAHLDRKEGPRALSRISETSRPGTHIGHHWAITQQFPSQHRAEKRRTSFTGLTKPPPQHRSSYLSELEKRFPKLEMPKLHCFTMSLGPKLPDAEEVRHNLRLHELEKNRKKYTYMLTKMHQMAMTNAAATSRILETHEDMDFIINGAPLTDLISDHFFYSGLPPSATQAEEHTEQQPICSSPFCRVSTQEGPLPSVLEQDEVVSVIQTSAMQSARDSGASKASKASRASRASKASRASSKQSKPKASPEPPTLPELPAPREITPLSLDTVVDKSRIVTAKCLSTLWTNYTKDTPPAAAAST